MAVSLAFLERVDAIVSKRMETTSTAQLFALEAATSSNTAFTSFVTPNPVFPPRIASKLRFKVVDTLRALVDTALLALLKRRFRFWGVCLEGNLGTD